MVGGGGRLAMQGRVSNLRSNAIQRQEAYSSYDVSPTLKDV